MYEFKIFHGFEGGAVPVYWGAPDIKSCVPPGSFINADDYFPHEVKLLALVLRRLDEDDEFYLSFFR